MEPSKNTSESAEPQNEARPAGHAAAGLFELEFPQGGQVDSARPKLTLEEVIRRSQEYRRWFALDHHLAARALQPRCETEFVL